MICFYNAYHSITLVAVLALIFYIGVCLPDRSWALDLLLSSLSSIIVYSVLGYFLPDQIPTEAYTVFSSYLGLSIFFLLLTKAITGSIMILLALMIVGPLLVAARNHMNHFFGLEMSETVTIVVVSILLLVVFLTMRYLFTRRILVDVVVCCIFSFLFILAVDVFIIMNEHNELNEFCCGPESDTCPVQLNTMKLVFFSVLVLLRLVMLHKWRQFKVQMKVYMKQYKPRCLTCCFKRKRTDKENKPILNGDKSDSDSDSDDNNNNSKVMTSEMLARHINTRSSSLISTTRVR